MKIINVQPQDNAVVYTVEVDKTLWQSKVKKHIDQAIRNIKIEGFRPGKAPLKLVQNRINKNEIYHIAINETINEILPEFENSKEFESDPNELLDKPSVDVKEISDDSLTINLLYDRVPNISLSSFDNLDINWSEFKTPTDEEVKKDIERILSWSKKQVSVTDRVLQKDDIAVIDFVGYMDGVQFPGGKGDGFKLKIGSKQFIDTFEDQLIGTKIGDTVKVEVTFPKKYHAKQYAGKPATFDVKLNEILVETEYKLDDNFAQSLNYPGVNNLKDLEDYIRNQLQERNESIFIDKVKSELVHKIANLVNLSYIPVNLLNDEIKRIQYIFEKELKDKKTTWPQYLKENNLSQEAVSDVIKNDAINAIKYAMAIDKISKDYYLVISDADYEEYASKLAKLYNLPLDIILEKLKPNEDYLREDLLNTKILKFIVSENLKNYKPKEDKKPTSKQKVETKESSSKTTKKSSSTSSKKPTAKKSK